MSWSDGLKTIIRTCATAISGNAMVRHTVCIASARLAEILASMVNSGMVQDFARVRENFQARMDAKTLAEEAEAAERVADATLRANEANLPKRRDALAKNERRRQELENAKLEVEIEAIKAQAEATRITAIGETQSRLLESIAAIQAQGGSVSFDLENLESILAQTRGLPPNSDENEVS